MDLSSVKPFKEKRPSRWATTLCILTSKPTIICQGLPETTFLHEKQFKCSLTGVTRLKEGRYNSRYRLSSGYGVTAKGQIIVKPKPEPEKVYKKPAPAAPAEPDQAPREKIQHRIARQIVKNRMRAMVNMLQTTTSRKRRAALYFFTITFLEGTPDDICYRVLNTWLTELRQKSMLKSYLWVAERQKNGTIHYHMAVPHYMNVHRANAVMKKILLDLFRKKELPHWPREKIMKYNGIDIAKNRDSKRPVNFAAGNKGASLANYLTKYITKNETTMEHLAWHCSRDWSALVLGITCTRQELGTFVTGKMIDHNFLDTRYCEFYRWTDYKPPDKLADHLGHINYEVLNFVTGKKGDYLYQLN